MYLFHCKNLKPQLSTCKEISLQGLTEYLLRYMLVYALIYLLLKKDKDPADYSSYRQLILLNVDLEIYAKVLARCILNHIPTLVSCDQT